MKTIGVIFGVSEPKPLVGFPEGETRIRMRANAFAKIFVRTGTAIRQFTIEEKDGKWIPAAEIGANYRKPRII